MPSTPLLASRPLTRVWLSIVVCLSAVLAMTLTGAATAHAASATFQVAWTKIGIYPRSAPSLSAAKVGSALSDGSWVTVVCETTGTSVTSDVATSAIWERLSNGTYLPNAFVNTHTNGWTPGIPRCDAPSPAPPATLYNRSAAVSWALAHYGDADVPLIPNCTYFASNVLNAGGISQGAVWTPNSTNADDQASTPLYLLGAGHGPTKRWASADYLKNYIVSERHLGTITEVSLSANNPGASPGDLIMYDWGGETPGFIDHVAVVIGVSSAGALLVAQKQPDQQARAWNWSLDQNTTIANAYPGTRVYVVHITY